MRNLDENDLKVLFESLGQILHNQDNIDEQEEEQKKIPIDPMAIF